MNSDSDHEKIVIALTAAQALVPFEFLSRFSDDDKLDIQDPAEARVLWEMCCDLESVFLEPFLPNYSELLQRACEMVRDEEGEALP